MLNFSFVIARYGPDILGGAEKHARDVAERLAARGHRVRVHTSCSSSYATWANDKAPGRSEIAGVEVIRHPTRVGRLRPFDEIFKLGSSAWPEARLTARAWAISQGPLTRGLLEAVVAEADQRDLTIFFSLLSIITFDGLPQVSARSALVPLVHEEPPIYTRVARDTLQTPRVLMVNTEEEAERIARVTGTGLPPVGIVAVGREEPAPARVAFSPPTTAPYLLILGRLGKTKPMLPVWRKLMEATDLPPLEVAGRKVPWREVRLVTVGQLSPLYVRTENVVALDFLSDEERWQILRGAVAVINPSVYESLSLVLLEAWACGIPVVVNRGCDVTVGQCERSGGGLPIDFTDETNAAIELARGLASESDRAAMAARGDAYARGRYQWPRVLGAYERVASAVSAGGSVEVALGDMRWEPASARTPRSGVE